jgi:hypothetical protein
MSMYRKKSKLSKEKKKAIVLCKIYTTQRFETNKPYQASSAIQVLLLWRTYMFRKHVPKTILLGHLHGKNVP